jgi:excisionase family DNA binding protein
MTDKILLTPLEAAALLGVGRTKLYEFLGTGQLFSVRLGRSRRIPRSAVDAFVEKLTASSTGAGGALALERPRP